MKKLLISLCLAAAALTLCAELRLAEDGKTKYTIIYRKSGDVLLDAAVQDLAASLLETQARRAVVPGTAYDVHVEGLENIPGQGGALLAMNHTAFVDAPIVQSVVARSMRFVMSREVFSTWKWCRPVFRLVRAIQIHTTDNAKALIRSINAARDALRGGELLAIYPEGELTPTGRIEEFRHGFEKMVKGTNAPIVPIYIGNLWGSIFSNAEGKPGLRLPRHLRPRRVTVRIGRPLPATATAQDVREAVLALGASTIR